MLPNRPRSPIRLALKAKKPDSSARSSGPLYHEAALSTSSSEWPVYRPARPTRERGGSCRLGPRSRCCVSLEQAARDSRSGCPSSICRSRSRHRHGSRRLSRCGVVARYEREDPFATTTADDQGGPRDSVAFIGRLIAGAAFLAASRSMASSNRGPGPERGRPVDHDQSAFQGRHVSREPIHALNPLMFGRQACGVPKPIFDAVDALATSSNGRVLAIGNPDDPSSHFAQICKPRSGWNVVTVSAFDTPERKFLRT
jgi:hypothetical protein